MKYKLNKDNIYNQGFTLIELLVVMSIIGMLSSVILVALTSARDRGRIGSGIVFSQTNYSALGSTAGGSYNFDEAVGVTVARDSSFNNRNLTLVGATLPTFVPAGGVMRGAISFNGTNYANTTVPIVLGSWTLSAWVNVGALNETGNRFLQTDQIWIGHNSGSRFHGYFLDNVTSGGLASQHLLSDTKTSKTNTWYLVTFTHNATKQLTTLYVDGKPVSTLSGFISKATNHFLYVGGSPGGLYNFNGLVDEAHLYTQALSVETIQNMYAEGEKKYKLASK
jgi:prepilin-type N-terminal cleavage/methylation domain-containing protein